jgi:hypothetical protein
VKKNVPAFDLNKAIATAFTAATIASNAFTPMAQAVVDYTPNFGTSQVLAEKVVREGLYRDYEVDLVQQYDDPRSTYKEAKETKSKKGKYTALLGVLVVGSFIIPMAQYFWYVKDDDSSDKFFAQQQKSPVPEPPKKKSGGFLGRKL